MAEKVGIPPGTPTLRQTETPPHRVIQENHPLTHEGNRARMFPS